MRSRALTWLICGVLLSGCELLGWSSRADVVTASADEAFEIEVGQTAVLEDLDARIRFVAPPEDGRCPIGLMCVWDGEIRASFELIYEGGTHPFTFRGFVGGTSDGPSLATDVSDLSIALKSLAPYPVHTPHPRRPTRAYTATLVVNAS